MLELKEIHTYYGLSHVIQGVSLKVEKGEMVPKLQASHAPPCKFWTAFQVINGIRHMAPVIHGPKGCTYSVASSYKMGSCEYRGVPFEPTSCTAQNETDVVYGGEGKLLEAQMKRMERIKAMPDWIDYAAIKPVKIGIVAGDGIGGAVRMNPDSRVHRFIAV